MKDIYILEYSLNELPIDRDSTKMLYTHFESKYFEKNDIDTTKYKASFQYYLNHPEQLSEVYEILTDSLSLELRLLKNEKSTGEE